VLKPWIIDGILGFISLPVLSSVYRRIYYPQILKKTSAFPTQLSIETYNVCNLKCLMCPYPQMTRAKNKMSMELFKKIIDDAAADGFKEINLTLYCEPLLDDLLFERIAYAKGKGLKVGLTSNGTMLSAAKSQAILESGLDWVFFSIDGSTKETYENVRIGAKFAETCANILGLIKLRKQMNLTKPMIIIHTTILDNRNLAASKSLERTFLGADRFTMALADSRGNHNFLFTKKSFQKSRKGRLYPCPFLWAAPSVMSNGKVCLCCKDYNGSIELGDLNYQTIRQVCNSEKPNKIKELHLKGEGDKVALCENCDSLYRSSLSWWAEREVKV